MNATLIMCDKENRMKEEALELADSYEIRANFIISHHEKSGRVRMSTTNQSLVKRYKNTADTIRKLVADVQSAEDTIGRLMLEINRLHNEKV
jgi:hypothetical protein